MESFPKEDQQRSQAQQLAGARSFRDVHNMQIFVFLSHSFAMTWRPFVAKRIGQYKEAIILHECVHNDYHELISE